MQHAFLITAYRDPEGLLALLDDLPRGCTAYIHYDRRADLDPTMAERISKHPAVRLLDRRHKVRWGGHAHLRAMLDLCRAAIGDSTLERLHLISASDRLVVSDATFFAHFERSPEAEYLEHFDLPCPYWYGGGLNRLVHYHPNDHLDMRSARHRRLRDNILRIQQLIRFQRPLPRGLALKGGSSWWSLTRTCVAEVLAWSDAHPAFYRRLRWTHVPEEIFFPTLVMASSRAAHVANDNLRYIDWVARDGHNPAVLDERDLQAIVTSGKLFARKLDHPTSTALLHELKALRKA
jgi:hypothetical protein